MVVVANSQGLLSPCAQRTGPPLARLRLALWLWRKKSSWLWRAALGLLPECELPQVGHRTHKHAIDILMRVPNRHPVPSRHCNVGGTILAQFERLAHLRLPFGRHVEFASSEKPAQGGGPSESSDETEARRYGARRRVAPLSTTALAWTLAWTQARVLRVLRRSALAAREKS